MKFIGKYGIQNLSNLWENVVKSTANEPDAQDNLLNETSASATKWVCLLIILARPFVALLSFKNINVKMMISKNIFSMLS